MHRFANAHIASSVTGFLALQLAKLQKLRVVCIVDVAKYGDRLMDAGADLLVDRLDTDRVVAIVRGVTKNRLRFGLDCVGAQTAEILQRCLATEADSRKRSHLVGLTGVPKVADPNVVTHKVPIKAFHDVQTVGEGLMVWLERLLLAGALRGPPTEVADGGLEGINNALDAMQKGTKGGKRVIVQLGQDL